MTICALISGPSMTQPDLVEKLTKNTSPPKFNVHFGQARRRRQGEAREAPGNHLPEAGREVDAAGTLCKVDSGCLDKRRRVSREHKARRPDERLGIRKVDVALSGLGS